MKIDYFSDNGTFKVMIDEDRIDIQNAEELQENLLNLIYNGHRSLLLDLHRVSFIDSSGLGALVFCLREVRKSEGTIRMSGLSEHVAAMFSITRLNKIFEIVKQ